MTPFVVAGSIVRNRAWVLDRHIAKVGFQRYGDLPTWRKELFYLTGDNSDGTVETLESWKNPKWGEGFEKLTVLAADGFDYLVHDTGEPGYTRDGSDGPRYRSAHMSGERNLWAREAIKRWPEATHLWVVDSDVLPEPDVLGKLLSLKAPVAAAFVPIMDGVTPTAMIGWDAENDRPCRTGEERILTQPHVATCVGSCYLVERDAYSRARNEYGAMWGEHPQGEDGWMAAAFRYCGLPMIHHPGARCTHLMKRDY